MYVRYLTGVCCSLGLALKAFITVVYVEPVCDERGRYTRQYAEEAEIHKRRAEGARGARALGRRPRPAAPALYH